MDAVVAVVGFMANLSTLLASCLAIWIFFSKRKTISQALNLLLSYSYRLTLSELREKLERLNEYDARNSDQYDEIINILHEIVGQIRGNDKLRAPFSEIVISIELISPKKKLTEHKKRNIVSELRERIRHLDVTSNAGGVEGVDK